MKKSTELSQKCLEALFITKKTILKLGEHGRTAVPTSKDEPVTKSDLEVSKALKKYFLDSGLNAVYQSEELGRINNPLNPKYAVFWDEVDGTFNWQRGGLLSSAAVISAFEYKENLLFKDSLFAGVLDLKSGDLWYAERNKGCYLNNKKVHSFGRRDLGKNTKLMLDLGPCPSIKLQKTFLDLNASSWVGNISCAGIHLAGVASGNFDGAVLPLQKAHELSAGYLLITESGRYIADFQGRDLANQQFDFNAKYQIVAADTKSLGEKILDKIR